MHINQFDNFQHRESPIHRLDPRAKVVVVLVFILSNLLLPDGAWLAFLLAWLMVVALNRLARLDYTFLFTRSLLALPFVLAALTVLFSIPGEPLLKLPIGRGFLIITHPGLVRFASILLRSWISVQVAILMTATTPFPDLIHALRHLRVPSILVSILSFMYRYLFVLSDEVLRLIRAREARSAKISTRRGGGTVFWRARVAGNMAGQLFLRSYERSDRIYQAMLARGYRGHLMTMASHTLERKDWLLAGVAVGALAALQLFARL